MEFVCSTSLSESACRCLRFGPENLDMSEMVTILMMLNDFDDAVLMDDCDVGDPGNAEDVEA
eukprot:8123740-Pyramimonas_sp.AAC.1